MRFIILFTMSLCLLNCAYATEDNIPRLNRAVSENPDNFDTVRQLVETYIDQHNYLTADSILNDYTQTHEPNAYAVYLEARLLDLTENINQAVDRYQQAFEMDSTLWQAYRDLAYLYDIF
jgi:Tfp pilus assembly protein PilF